ncbi:MAG: sporulation transcriptional regulator SpoIIID [Kiritimatiellae bacterium]|nr:sporulation transcriptional regulator SpoIIID [Kiritimatiellia bacterium]
MKNDIEERVRELAAYLLEQQCTVRAAAARFGVSKSTVHKDMSERLEQIDRTLWLRVRGLLERNKAERHIRGGLATRRKYRGE